jgi:hypothetical protein
VCTADKEGVTKKHTHMDRWIHTWTDTHMDRRIHTWTDTHMDGYTHGQTDVHYRCTLIRTWIDRCTADKQVSPTHIHTRIDGYGHTGQFKKKPKKEMQKPKHSGLDRPSVDTMR